MEKKKQIVYGIFVALAIGAFICAVVYGVMN